MMSLAWALLLIAAPAPRQPNPVQQMFQEDPQFPIVALFGRTETRREWAVRTEDATLVVLGGPQKGWLIGWDLATGQQKFRVRAPLVLNTVDSREMGPTGKVLFFLPKEQPGKDGKTPRIVHYHDTSTGKLVKTASFDTSSPNSIKVPGNTQDDRALIQRFAGGLHPKQTAQIDFEKKLSSNQGLYNRAFTADLLHLVATDPARKTLYVIDVEKPRVVAELPLPALGHYAAENLAAEYSPDRGLLVLRTGTHALGIVEISKKKLVRELIGHTQTIHPNFRLSPDGTRLLSASLDGTARIWDVAQGKALAVPVASGSIQELGFVTAGEKAGIVVDARAARLVKYDGSPLRTVGTFLSARAVLTEDGKFALDTIDGSEETLVHFWKLDPAQLLWELRLSGGWRHSTLSADGRHALVQTHETFHLVDAQQAGAAVWSGKLPGTPLGVLPGGGGIVVFQDKSVTAIETPSLQKRWTVEVGDSVRSGRLNATGSHAVVVAGIPRVLDLAKGAVVSGAKFPAPLEAPTAYGEVFVSGDGRTVVTLDKPARTIQWRSLEGDLLKAQNFPQAVQPDDGRFFVPSDSRRAYLCAGNRIVVVTPEKGVEKTYVFHPTTAHTVQMHGDFAVIQGNGASTLLRYVAK